MEESANNILSNTWGLVEGLLLSGFVKGALVVLVIWGLTILWKSRSAADRHLFWVLGLASFLVLPIAQQTGARWDILPRLSLEEVLPNHERPAGVPLKAENRPLQAEAPVDPASEAYVGGEQHSVTMPIDTDAESPLALREAQAMPWWFLVWAAGVVCVGLRVLLGSVMLGSLTRELEGGAIQRRTDVLARQLDIEKPVQVFVSQRRAMPMTWGLRRPKILLPQEAGVWDQSRLDAVLSHELAHVKRGDSWVQILVQVVTALYWFHPLVWISVRRLVVERERACDDLVVARSGLKPSAYARHLMAIALADRAVPALPMAGTMSMARPSQLEGRVKNLLDATVERQPMRRFWMVVLTLSWGVFVLPLATLHSQELKDVEPEVEAEAATPPTSIAETPPEERPFDVEEDDDAGAGKARSEKSAYAFLRSEFETLQEDLEKGRVELEAMSRRLKVDDPDLVERRRNVDILADNVAALRARLIDVERLIAAEDELAQLRVRYTDRHPKVIAQQERIRSLREPINAARDTEEERPETGETEERGRERLLAIRDPRLLDEEKLMSQYVLEAEALDELRIKYLDRHPKIIERKASVVQIAERLEALRATIRVATPQPGIVVQVSVKLGDRVERGDILVRLDRRRAELDLQTAKSRLVLAESQLAAAHQSLELMRETLGKQVQNGMLSQAQQGVQQAPLELEVRKVQAELTLAHAAVEKAEIDLDDLTVRAPANGEIVRIEAHPGEYVSPERPVIHLKKDG